tara:strand:- start:10816 stop:11478 length:663 start_codon:yes stop_codon:yes gene_type:complete
METRENRRVWSALIGAMLGIGVLGSISWESWPDVNLGFQFLIVSCSLFLYSFSSYIETYTDLRYVVYGISFGLLCGLLFQLGEPMYVSIVLLLTSISLILKKHNFADELSYLATLPLFVGIPISILSILSKEIEIFEILIAASILMAILWMKRKIVEEMRRIVGYIPLSIVLGTWIFREINGNLEFVGVDAFFNILLVLSCYVVLIIDKKSFFYSEEDTC